MIGRPAVALFVFFVSMAAFAQTAAQAQTTTQVASYGFWDFHSGPFDTVASDPQFVYFWPEAIDWRGKPAFAIAPIHLPDGAVILKLDIDECHTSNGGMSIDIVQIGPKGGKNGYPPGVRVLAERTVPTDTNVPCGVTAWPMTVGPLDNDKNLYYIQLGENPGSQTAGIRLTYSTPVGARPRAIQH